jgi:competence CoiA-like predicted nuclease
MENNFVFKFGALNPITNGYECIQTAQKGLKYICPDCSSHVIVKMGEHRIKHFAHKSLSSCCYYTRPGETEQHKEAKLKFKHILERRLNLQIRKKEMPLH